MKRFLLLLGNSPANHASYLERSTMDSLNFESVVEQYYEPLYRFAFSLARTEADARDLTQQTFYVWATKGHQLLDPGSAKTWLFTTLHRVFLQKRRRETRFPHEPLEETDEQLPFTSPVMANELDWEQVLEALDRVEVSYQAAIALFYLQDCSYKEIAEILEVPIGTVKSRLARGLGQLKKLLTQTSPSRRVGKAHHE
jgi:RNA polymerase sigma-70 factor (ECF subfamily)